jgi:hypothetical protein
VYRGYSEDSIGFKRKYDKFLQLKNTEEKNRYKGISQMKNGKWRAYTSGAMKLKPIGIGVFDTKEEASNAVNSYYQSHRKNYMV